MDQNEKNRRDNVIKRLTGQKLYMMRHPTQRKHFRIFAIEDGKLSEMTIHIGRLLEIKRSKDSYIIMTGSGFNHALALAELVGLAVNEDKSASPHEDMG